MLGLVMVTDNAPDMSTASSGDANESSATIGSVTRGPNDIPYLKEAKENSVMLYHRRALQLNILKFQELIDKNIKYLQSNGTNELVSSNAISAAEALLKRKGVSSSDANIRCTDDIELLLISLMDNDGKISMCSRISDLIVIMTRISQIDHRALAMFIIEKKLTDLCKKEFVSQDGFKLLKKWLEEARNDGCIEQMRTIIAICKILPFDSKAISNSGIGKFIKKDVSTFKSEDTMGLDSLKNDVADIYKFWGGKAAEREQQKKKNAATGEIPEIVKEISSHMLEVNGAPLVKEVVKVAPVNIDKPMSYAENHDKTGNVTSTRDDSAVKQGSDALTKTSSIAPANAAKVVKPSTQQSTGTSTSTIATPAVTSVATVNSAPKPSTKNSVTAILAANKAMGLTSDAQIKDSKVDADKPKRKVDMAAEARRRAALLQPEQSIVSEPSSLGVIDANDEPKALVSILKRKRIDTAVNAAVNDVKKVRKLGNIKWADENGGTLRHTLEFESESNFTKSTKDDKNKKSDSVRDKAKREAQSEKEIHNAHFRDAMNPNIEWKKPQKILLPRKILDYLEDTVLESTELDVQTKRVSREIEARYLDDSLIPPDPPHEAPVITISTEPLEQIPWEMPGDSAMEVDNSIPQYLADPGNYRYNTAQSNNMGNQVGYNTWPNTTSYQPPNMYGMPTNTTYGIQPPTLQPPTLMQPNQPMNGMPNSKGAGKSATVLCKKLNTPGGCPFGDNCSFFHPPLAMSQR